METFNIAYKGYLITSDKSLMDISAIHYWLSNHSYWAAGTSFEKVKASFEHSWCIGILKDKQQAGFARVITDYTTFGYLADVYVMDEHRGQGLSKAMMAQIMQQPWIQQLKRFMLATKDAHGLYEQYGFSVTKIPDRLMEIIKSNPY